VKSAFTKGELGDDDDDDDDGGGGDEDVVYTALVTRLGGDKLCGCEGFRAMPTRPL
jgi:hypothetical protein